MPTSSRASRSSSHGVESRHVKFAPLLLLAACGRLGFDSQAGTHDAPSAADARLPASYYALSSNTTSPPTILEVDLATGEVSVMATLPMSLGAYGGLAYWDANTFYLSGDMAL